jgi:hypothetical protein
MVPEFLEIVLQILVEAIQTLVIHTGCLTVTLHPLIGLLDHHLGDWQWLT